MVLLQFLGQGAYILMSLVLALKLLSLWRRTGELPELTLGLSFLLGGFLGFVSWLVLGAAAVKGASQGTLHTIALTGLAFCCIGSTCNGIGVARIFRPGWKLPLVGVALVTLVMLGGWVAYLRSEPVLGSSNAFWVALLGSAPIYVWGSAEALTLARALHKRARIGLADPVVVNRLGQWGLAGVSTVAMMLLSLYARIQYGPVPAPSVMVGNAALGLLGATAIWLGFFPPQAVRERVARAYAS